MSLALDGRGRLKHITATPLKSDDPKFIKWRQADSTVITWILENIESDIVNQYIDYPTAWDLWKGIEATYGSGKDPLQVYNLMVKASSIKQGDQTLEKVYSQLQAVWKEIDRRRPNPMKCPEDMTIFTQIQQQNRLYQFLQAINEEFDVEKRDILKTDPLPSVEEAYAQIRREATRKGIMKGDDGPSSGDVPSGLGSGFAVTRAGLRSEKEIAMASKLDLNAMFHLKIDGKRIVMAWKGMNGKMGFWLGRCEWNHKNGIVEAANSASSHVNSVHRNKLELVWLHNLSLMACF
ncbi:unnamed protein product [Cuscuta campestris]|uniref:Retrotransposon gag domain-containing protein n=1 Tax=Cuscuta campestris TaxID=132261 RepID=A0A484N789_9ASTE|nr:unnamed protein product [Cuscuta campestris]